MTNTQAQATSVSTTASDEATTLGDIAAACTSRAGTYALLARLFEREVDNELLETLRTSRFAVHTGSSDMDKGHKLMATYLSSAWEGTLTELAADFMRTFFGHGYNGHAAAYPYESVFTSEKRLMMQEARDEVLAIYRAAGLDKSLVWKESEDHIAPELQYMATITERCATACQKCHEDEAISLFKAQENFLQDHLYNWAPLLCESMRKFAKTDFYVALSYICAGFLDNEVLFLKEILQDC